MEAPTDVDGARFASLLPQVREKCKTALVWRERKLPSSEKVIDAALHVGPFYCTATPTSWYVDVLTTGTTSNNSNVRLGYGVGSGLVATRTEAERFLKILLLWIVDDVTKREETR